MDKLISLKEFLDKNHAKYIMTALVGDGYWVMNAQDRKAILYLSGSVPTNFLSMNIYRTEAPKGELLYFVMEDGIDGKNWLYCLEAGDTIWA